MLTPWLPSEILRWAADDVPLSNLRRSSADPHSPYPTVSFPRFPFLSFLSLLSFSICSFRAMGCVPRAVPRHCLRMESFQSYGLRSDDKAVFDTSQANLEAKSTYLTLYNTFRSGFSVTYLAFSGSEPRREARDPLSPAEPLRLLVDAGCGPTY